MTFIKHLLTIKPVTVWLIFITNCNICQEMNIAKCGKIFFQSYNLHSLVVSAVPCNLIANTLARVRESGLFQLFSLLNTLVCQYHMFPLKKNPYYIHIHIIISIIHIIRINNSQKLQLPYISYNLLYPVWNIQRLWSFANAMLHKLTNQKSLVEHPRGIKSHSHSFFKFFSSTSNVKETRLLITFIWLGYVLENS